MQKCTDILFLFDVDGTLCHSRDSAPPEIFHMLRELRKRVCIGFVGGSDLAKLKEQFGESILTVFDYGFPENGVQFYRDAKLVREDSFIKFLGEENYKKLVNRILLILSKTECPVKRGTFVEFRSSMINISPIGRSCSRDERLQFYEYDKVHKVRQKICSQINNEFRGMGIRCAIGGQISVDIFPHGWDKTYCLEHIQEPTIVFFGDMTMEDGNDYEIFMHERVLGVTVGGPEDTFAKVNSCLRDLKIPEIE